MMPSTPDPLSSSSKTSRLPVAKQLDMFPYGFLDFSIRQLQCLVRPADRFVKAAALGISRRQRVQDVGIPPVRQFAATPGEFDGPRTVAILGLRTGC